MSTPYRRSTDSSRLRENRPQPSNNAAARHRRKSRSPEARNEDSIPQVPAPKPRRPAGAGTPNASATSRPASGTTEEERGRKSRQNKAHTGSSADQESHTIPDNQHRRRYGKAKKKERSVSREAGSSVTHTRKTKSPEPEDMDVVEERHYSGPLAAADYVRMRDEIDALKKHIASVKKTMHKQSKTIEDLKKDVVSAHKSHNEERHTVAKLKAEAKKNNEIVTAVEANLACQICMEILMKPYGLSPCGHVLCLGCLQEWFRTTPAGDEDMDEDEPEPLLYRKKTCPVCRSEVFHRPIPLFLVKSIATAFEKAKQGSPRRSSPLPEGDPWAGIFPDAVSPYENDDDDFESASEDSFEEGDYYEDADAGWPLFGYGSDSDEEFFDGEYVPARWAPPTVDVHRDDYPFEDISDEMLSMLRRGATPQMIALFSMEYTHEEGLRAMLDDNTVYLGWNISLKSGDEAGEEYMEWVEADLVNHPERWEQVHHGDCWTAFKCVRNDEDEDYELTDSEMWADELSDMQAGI